MQQLYIQVDGRALDLAPGTILEIEEQNPFLQLNDELQGDYSLPVDVPLTDNNKITFKHIQLLPSTGKLQQIDNVIAGDSMEQFQGILKKEQFQGNLNHAGMDKLSLYLLKGWSHFYNDVKDKTLQDADYGGDRDFGATDQFRVSNYLIAYLENVMLTGTIDTYDYALFPVYNSMKTGQAFLSYSAEESKVSNITQVYNGQPKLFAPWLICLYPYINYVIRRVFQSFGWSVDGFIFNNPDWKKAVLLNTHYIDPIKVSGRSIMNLKDSIPAVKISTFLIALKNRFGWWYDFDYQKKTCVIRKISDVFSGVTRKNITHYCYTSYTLKIPPEKKIYGLNAVNADGIDISKWNLQQTALSKISNLPTANESNNSKVYFVVGENRFYICQIKDNTNDSLYEWVVLSENDFGYLPAGKTDDITTACLIPSTKVADYRQFGIESPPVWGKIAIPEIALSEDNIDTEQFYVCFAHGLKDDLPINNRPVIKYPFGSPSNYDMTGSKLTSFAMNYRFYAPGTPLKDEGLYETFWKDFLSRLNQAETIEITARMPQRLAMELRWQDTVLINNVEYIITKKNRTLPYNDQIKLTLARI